MFLMKITKIEICSVLVLEYRNIQHCPKWFYAFNFQALLQAYNMREIQYVGSIHYTHLFVHLIHHDSL